MEAEGHEQVVFCSDSRVGLRAIVAIHDTTLGPALGGIRVRSYASEEEALRDVLRLAKAMTFKAAVAGLDLGGGKAVVVGIPPRELRAEVFRALGRFVDSLGGRYIPTEDMGTDTEDLQRLRETSRYGVGLPEELGGGGDPSPMTALGVVCGMRAAIEAAGLPPGLRRKRVVVQGVGKVGLALARDLLAEGAEVLVCDLEEERVRAAERLGAVPVPCDGVFREPCDVFAPCAAGGVLNARTIPELGARIVAGGANNQLESDLDEERLRERGILWAPDFVINAGGLIQVAAELDPGGFDRRTACERTERIESTLKRIFAESKATGELPGQVALRLARERLAGAVRE
jgi:glutamate dehydrogenase/leucine dehydrogenase